MQLEKVRPCDGSRNDLTGSLVILIGLRPVYGVGILDRLDRYLRRLVRLSCISRLIELVHLWLRDLNRLPGILG